MSVNRNGYSKETTRPLYKSFLFLTELGMKGLYYAFVAMFAGFVRSIRSLCSIYWFPISRTLSPFWVAEGSIWAFRGGKGRRSGTASESLWTLGWDLLLQFQKKKKNRERKEESK